MKTIHEQSHTFQEWFKPEQIAADVQQVAAHIRTDYAGKEPLFVVVLNGAFIFAADLIRALEDLRCEVTFIRVRSYNGMASTGTIEYLVPLQQSVKDRDVIVIEDIIDSGLTIHHLKTHLHNQGASSVRVAAMLLKPAKLEYDDARPDYVGREISNEFVIGYGLDLDGYVRNLASIYKIKE